MREIKFRAYEYISPYCPSLGKEMVYDVQNDGVDLDYSRNHYSFRQLLGGQGLSPVMQYTGFKDRNGKEIYEGDILIVEARNRRFIRGVVRERSWDTGFEIEHKEDVRYPLWCHSEQAYEVIGNIYENPELLEESSDARD